MAKTFNVLLLFGSRKIFDMTCQELFQLQAALDALASILGQSGYNMPNMDATIQALTDSSVNIGTGPEVQDS